MNSHKLIYLFALLHLLTVTGRATSYHVAITGSNSNPGTAMLPFATVAKAVTLPVAGDTIWVHGGTYAETARITLSRSGTAAASIVMCSFPGDTRPVIDFSGMPIGSNNQGMLLNNASYWHIKGLRVRGAGDNGMQISGGGNNKIEYCDFFENRDSGFQLKSATHDNTIINCDAFFNADYVAGSSTYDGGNADGFAPKLDIGTGNYFFGCRAWLNSDDGWDGFLYSDVNVTTTIENCWSWANGYLKDAKTTTSSMNGNGFKMGGGWTTDSVGVKHYTFRHNQVLKNCLTFNNKAKGFDQNHNVGSMTIINCSAKSNGGNNFDIGQTLASGNYATIKNSLSYESGKMSLLASAIVANNTWSAGLGVSSSDIVSIDTSGVSASRKVDGSLPEITYLHLAPGSKLIDAGTDVGLPFNGARPDIGCFETAAPTSVARADTKLPETFELFQNYPNPFNPNTTIAFMLPSELFVSVKIYSGIGQEVETIAAGQYASGMHEVHFDGSALSSGVYWFRIQAGTFAGVKQMVLVK